MHRSDRIENIVKSTWRIKLCSLIVFSFFLSCATTNSGSEDRKAQTTSKKKQETTMPNDKDSQTSSPRDSFLITSDVIIPEYKSLDLPYSKWETQRSQELLEANGIGYTLNELRIAAQHSSGLIRSTAYYLLTLNPQQQDKALFHQGLDDIDETVQTFAAYGLYKLGDKSVLSILERIAHLDVNAHTAATRAAGILAEIGDPTAFTTIQKALNSDLSYIRLFAIQNAMPFVPLHGQIFTTGQKIDIWGLYQRALKDKDGQVRSVAKFQLKELNSPKAFELLRKN